MPCPLREYRVSKLLTPNLALLSAPSHGQHIGYNEEKFTPCKVRHSPSGIIYWVRRPMMIVFPLVAYVVPRAYSGHALA